MMVVSRPTLFVAFLFFFLAMAATSATAARPSGPCAARGKTYDECHGKEFDGQKCNAADADLCVLCDADTDNVACKPLSQKGSCKGWTYVCSVRNSDDGSKAIKHTCRDDCEDSASGSFVEENGFEGKSYCRCSGSANLMPSLLLAAVAAVAFCLQ
jgi:hypothetical protein